MDPIIGSTLIGAGTSLLGGILGRNAAKDQAQATLDAQREALAAQQGNAQDNLVPSLFAMFGGQEGERLARLKYGGSQWNDLFGVAPTAGQTLTPDEQRQLEGLISQRDQITTKQASRSRPHGNNYINSSTGTDPQLASLNAQIDVLQKKAGGDAGKSGRFDLEKLKASAGPGIFGEMDALTAKDAKAGKGTLGRYDAESRRLNQRSRAIEKMGADYGKGEEDAIKRDMLEAQTGANRASMTRLAGSGMGDSSLAPAYMNENAAQYAQMGSDLTREARDRAIQLRTGLAQNSLGLDSQRSGARTSLGMSLDDRNMAMAQQPVNQKLSLYTGPLFNPNQGVNMSQFYQPSSPSASGNAALASSLSAIGGQFMGGGVDMFGTKRSQQQQQVQRPVSTNLRQQMGSAGTSNYDNMWAA